MPKRSCSFIACALFFLIALPAPLSAQSSDDANTFRERKDQEGYILNLKDLIKQSKNKIEKVNDKLQDQARKRRNQQREEKAREYYQKAMLLFEQEKYDEAIELWEKSVKITQHPEMEDYVDESAIRMRKQEEALARAEKRNIKRLEVERGYSVREVEKTYQKAVKQFEKGDYLEAQQTFERVNEMFPDHKATNSYLMLVKTEIQKDQNRIIEDRLKESKIATNKEKQQWKQEILKKEENRKMAVVDQADQIYTEAVRLYKNEEFKQAKERFKEVEWLVPDYKSTLRYLARIDSDIERKQASKFTERQNDIKQDVVKDFYVDPKSRYAQLSQHRQDKEQEMINRLNDEAEFIYQMGMNLYEEGKYDQAREKFVQARALLPNYKSTDQYLGKINNEISSDVKNRSHVKAPIASQALPTSPKTDQDLIKTRYDQAIALYKNKKYVEAKNLFLDVDALHPGYRRTERYLRLINTKQSQPIVKESNSEKKMVSSAGNSNQPVNDQLKEAVEKRSERFRQEAQSKYDEALQFYRQTNYVEAKRKFIAVEAIYPDFKDTITYLSRIDDDINAKLNGVNPVVQNPLPVPLKNALVKKEEPIEKYVADVDQEKLESLYRSAVSEMKKKRYVKARSLFYQINELDPNYKRTERYLTKVEQELTRDLEGVGIQEAIDRAEGRPSSHMTTQHEYQTPTMSQVKTIYEFSQNENVTWEAEQERRVRRLKEKERYATELSGERKKEFLAKIEHEKQQIAKSKELRRLRDKERQAQLRERIRQEEEARKITARQQQELVLEAEQAAIQEKKVSTQENKVVVPENVESNKVSDVSIALDDKTRMIIEELKQQNLEAQQRIAALEESLAEREKNLLIEQENQEDKLKDLDNQEEIIRKLETASQANKPTEVAVRDDEALLRKYELQKLRIEQDRHLAKQQLKSIKDAQMEINKQREREVRKTQAAVEKSIEHLKKEERDRLVDHVEQLYQDGLDLYRARSYGQARLKFASVDGLYPGYRSARKYLRKSIRRMGGEYTSRLQQISQNQENENDRLNEENDVTPEISAPGNETISHIDEKTDEEMASEIESTRKEYQDILAERDQTSTNQPENVTQAENILVQKEKMPVQINLPSIATKEESKAVSPKKISSIDEQLINEPPTPELDVSPDQADRKPTLAELEKQHLKKLAQDSQKLKQNKAFEKALLLKQANELEKQEREANEAKKKLLSKIEIDSDQTSVGQAEARRLEILRIRQEEQKAIEQAREKEYLEKLKQKKEKLAAQQEQEELIKIEMLKKKEEELVLAQKKEEMKKLEMLKKKEEQTRLAQEKAEQLKIEQDRQAKVQAAQSKVEALKHAALHHYDAYELASAESKFSELNDLLKDNKFLKADYVHHIKNEINNKKTAIDLKYQQLKEQNELKVLIIEHDRTEEKRRRDSLRQKELAELRSKIKEDEDRIIEKKQELIVQSIKAKTNPSPSELGTQIDDALKDSEKLLPPETFAIKRTDVPTDPVLRRELEEQKKKELLNLTQRRKESIEEKRMEIQREFEKRLLALYDKAVAHYKQGDYLQAERMFGEIKHMRPGYKKCDYYLTKIEDKSPSEKKPSGFFSLFNKNRNVKVDLQSVETTSESKPILSDAPVESSRLRNIEQALDQFEQ